MVALCSYPSLVQTQGPPDGSQPEIEAAWVLNEGRPGYIVCSARYQPPWDPGRPLRV